MAEKMASIYTRGQTQWIKFCLPGHPGPCRESLGRINAVQANLIRRKLEMELALRQPEFLSVSLPENLLRHLEIPPAMRPPVATMHEPPTEPPPSFSPSPSLKEVLSEYVAFIRTENSAHHARNKIGCLKKFFGATLLGLGTGESGVFQGTNLNEVRAADIRRLIDGLPVGKKSKRHHRNAFHSLFEFALKSGYFVPTNFRYPNPMAALPTYHEKNKPIAYLAPSQIEAVLQALQHCPSVRIAAALMIHAGLRRAEALWLRRENLSPDLRFFSVVNKADDEQDIESSLKTGERPVPILPPLKAILEPYLGSLEGDWVCPSPKGLQWEGDNFGARHRDLLRAAGLRHTCLHYRHTFATQRASENWSLFRIAKTMGNSVAVCEKYYAAFIDPILQ